MYLNDKSFVDQELLDLKQSLFCLNYFACNFANNSNNPYSAEQKIIRRQLKLI